MTAAIILAGGHGRRVGRPKAEVVLAGDTMTLVERAVAIARGAGCAPIVVASRVEVALPALPGVEVIFDRGAAEGPLAALRDVLEALDSIDPRRDADVLVIACDLPNVAPVVARLLAMPPGVPVAAVDESERVQPLCARYPRAAALAVARDSIAAGDRRMRSLVERLAAEPLRASDVELRNVNEPGDLATSVLAEQDAEVAAVDERAPLERRTQPDRDR